MILSTLMLECIDTLTQEHFRLIFEKLKKSELDINRYIDMGMYAREVLKRYPGDRDWFYFLVQAMIDIYKKDTVSLYVYRFFLLMEKKYVDNNLVMYMLKNGGEDLIHHLPLSVKQKNRISDYIYKKRRNQLLLNFQNE